MLDVVEGVCFFSVVYSTSISNKIEYTFKCTSDGSEGSSCNLHFFEKFEFWFVKVAKLAAVHTSIEKDFSNRIKSASERRIGLFVSLWIRVPNCLGISKSTLKYD